MLAHIKSGGVSTLYLRTGHRDAGMLSVRCLYPDYESVLHCVLYLPATVHCEQCEYLQSTQTADALYGF